MKKWKKSGDKFFEDNVLVNFDTHLNYMFDGKPNLSAKENNLYALESITKICAENNIELTVVIGPTFITELYQFEGSEYWQYLRGIASLTNFWDFSGFNDVDRNPYNFIDHQHYNIDVGNKILDIMYGKDTKDGFGIYVTQATADKYLEERAAKYTEMEKEFRETGTIELFDRTHESYIKTEE